MATCQWARQQHLVDGIKWIVLAIPSSQTSSGDSTGMVDLEILNKILSGEYQYKSDGIDSNLDPSDIAIVCITHVPTNSGIINPVESIGEQIADFNQRQQQKEGPRAHYIKYLVDACQSVGQLEVDVQSIHCHAMVATGRKYLRGPRGTGFLYIANELLQDNIMPSHIDHYGCPVSSVPSPTSYQDGVQLQQDTVIRYIPRENAVRFEFWESNVANRLGLGEAVCYAMDRGLPQIEHAILQLSVLLRKELNKLPKVKIHHHQTTKCGIVTFQCEDIAAQTVHAAMLQQGFELSVVPATSTPLDSSKTHVPDLNRASITYINTEEEIFSIL